MVKEVGNYVNMFNGTDFETWKIKIKAYLCVNDPNLPLKGKKPESMEDFEWELLDAQALEIIRARLSKKIVQRTANENTAAGLMATLADLYALKPTAYNKVQLTRQLLNLKMKAGTSATEHLSKFNYIIFQLSSINVNYIISQLSLSTSSLTMSHR